MMVKRTNTYKTEFEKDEYLDLTENMRHWNTIRFGQMTVFMALMAGILSSLYQSSFVFPDFVRLALKTGGIIFTLIFWSLDYREMLYFRHFRTRAVELEEILGFRQFSRYPSAKIINSARLTGAMYFFVLVFWIGTFIWR
jgi:hypothetical protein